MLNRTNTKRNFAGEMVFVFFLIVVTLEHFAAFSQTNSSVQPRNVELTSKAWDAYDGKNYSQAIKLADKCIDAFEGSAQKTEDRLAKENIKLPQGEVTPEEKKNIEQNGLLNDVGACYIIKGLSLVELNRKEEAKVAFKEALKLKHARVWDINNKWFWSPADKADDELDKLNQK
jgi:hypothetical protein